MITKKTINTILVLSAFALVAFGIYRKSSISKGKMKPDNLPETLKSAYQLLLKKGYKPEIKSVKPSNTIITFSFKAGEQQYDVVIDSQSLITIVEKGGMSIPPIQFVNGDFIQNDYVIAQDNDIVNGTLQIIQNKDYKP